MSFRTRDLFTCIALLASVGCASSRTDRSDVLQSGTAPGGARLLEGYYAICDGAYSHRESLILGDGEFQHFIQTHGINGSRSSGRYAVVGDTLTMQVTQTGPAPQGVIREIPLRYDFVIGEYAGYGLVWRGKAAAARMSADTARISQYDALFYGGPDATSRSVPSCAELGRPYGDRDLGRSDPAGG